MQIQKNGTENPPSKHDPVKVGRGIRDDGQGPGGWVGDGNRTDQGPGGGIKVVAPAAQELPVAEKEVAGGVCVRNNVAGDKLPKSGDLLCVRVCVAFPRW